MNDTNGMFICKNCDAEVDAAECIASGRFTCPSCGKQADLYVGDGPTATGHVQARKHPIIFLAMHKGGMYHLSNREYDLYVTAATLPEALEDARDQLRLLWHVYVECDEIELTDKAVFLRESLIKRIGIYRPDDRVNIDPEKFPRWSQIPIEERLNIIEVHCMLGDE